MSNYNFRNLVFEGGGVRGIAYGGALGQLEQRGILSGIERVAGTSTGGIIAVLLAVGYNDKEISDIIEDLNFNDFLDANFVIFSNIERFFSDFGWHKGDFFRDWIGKLIKDKTQKKNLTFQELKSLGGTLDLYLVATNLSSQLSEIFSHEHTPNMEIRDAARMSMSIPFYFKCVRYGSGKDVMVDGGIAWNYPLSIFDNKSYLDDPKNDEAANYNKNKDYVFNHETLGFRLGSLNEIEGNKSNRSNASKDIDNIPNYVVALIGFMFTAANKAHLHKNDWERTIFIDTLGVNVTDFNLKGRKKKSLIESGKNGVKTYFKWRDKSFSNKPA